MTCLTGCAWNLAVPQYRIYYIALDGHFSSVENIECADDQAAIQTARQAVNGQSVELWQSDRFLVRLPHGEPQSN